jgi:hypothetical protein
MEYFNGIRHVDVSDIDCLKDMTQETANAIATGPQDAFFTLLDNFNSDLNYFIGDTIDVTDKWNWKPGTYDKIDKMILKRLNFDKKSNGIYNKISKIRERSNYLNYVMRNAQELENQKYRLKQSGLSKNVNIGDFQDKANKLVDAINTQCNLVQELTEGKVIIKPYISQHFENRLTPIYLDVKLFGLTLSVYSGDKSIQEIMLQPIHLVMKYPFRHYINNQATRWKVCGNYAENDRNIRFPYISTSYHDRTGEFGTVCLDRFNDDILKSFLKVDYIQMAMHLMNWAQYYSTNHSNPYNNLKFLHYGLPKGYSTEYKAVLSDITTDCASRITNTPLEDDCITYYDELKEKTLICNGIECQLKESCNLFSNKNLIMKHFEDKTDIHYQIESMIGYIVGYTDTLDEGNKAYLSETSVGYAGGDFNKTFIEYLFRTIYSWNYPFNTIESIPSFYRVLNRYYHYEANIVQVEKNEEDIKQEMLAWATNPGRRQDGTR